MIMRSDRYKAHRLTTALSKHGKEAESLAKSSQIAFAAQPTEQLAIDRRPVPIDRCHCR
jgi:hypothetical protein